MTHTNGVRVILGGLLAGLVINIVEFITNGVVLREAWGHAMQALGKSGQLSAGAIVIFNIWGFLLGIAAVWLYAAIRPRNPRGTGRLGRWRVSREPRQLSLGPFPHAAARYHL
jgi:hypothetical protein